MPRILPKTKMFAIAIALALMAGLIVVIIIFPTYRDIIKLNKEIERIQGFLETQYQKTRFLRRSIRELDSVAKETATYESTLLKKTDGLSAITEFEKIATAHKIKQNISLTFSGDLNNPRPGSAAEKPYYLFSFLNYGKFSDHLAFLSDVEKLPFYVVIDNVHFEKKDASDQNIWLRFGGKVYIRE